MVGLQLEFIMKQILLVDGNALMHRAYHGVKRGFNPVYNGMPIGMVYGFASTILRAIDFLNPDILFVTFDTKEKTFRHTADTEYKAHREKAPDDFYPQVPYIDEFLEAFEIPSFRLPGYESDDLIGTMAKKAESDGFSTTILSGDMDFLQLVSDRIHLLKLNGALEQSPQFGPAEAEEKLGVSLSQVVDFKALTGDASDNYKGIGGLGPKTAQKLLTQFGSIAGIYEHIDELPEKWKIKFEDQKEYLMHCQMLAKIAIDVPVEFSWDDTFHWAPETSVAFFEKMNFYALKRRYESILKENGVEPTEKKDEAQASLFTF